MPSRSRQNKIDQQLLADPEIRAAIAARQMSLWQDTVAAQQARRPLVEPKLPWGSRFMVAVDTSANVRHATTDRIVAIGCNFGVTGMALANGVVGPNGTWRKPDCPPCLEIVESWEAAHA